MTTFFQRDGFAGPFDIISGDEAKIALQEVQNELSVEGANRFKLHLVLPSIDRIAHHPKLIDAVKDALESDDIWLWSSDVNTKKGQSSYFFAPHQDSRYAGLSPSAECVTVWIALSDPVGENEGCLSFYPGSHQLGQLPHHVEKSNTNNMLSLGQYIDEATMNTLKSSISIPLRAGQATLHSFDCVHASGPNKSPFPRVGLALRYMTCNVKQTKPTREMATWICGKRHDDISERDPSLLIVRHNNDTAVKERAMAVQKQQLSELQCGSCFDIEPRLPLHPNERDIERGRQAQKEAMEREDLNYFCSSSEEIQK